MKKRYGENENITEIRKGSSYIEMKKYFVLDLRKGNSSNFTIIYRYYKKDNKDILRIKK